MNNFDFTYKMQLDNSANHCFNEARHRVRDISRIKNEIDLVNLKIDQNSTMMRIYGNRDYNYANIKRQLEYDLDDLERKKDMIISRVSELLYESLENALKSLFISLKYNDSMAIMFGGNFIEGIYQFMNGSNFPKEIQKVFIKRCSYGEVRSLIDQLKYQIPPHLPLYNLIDSFDRFIYRRIY